MHMPVHAPSDKKYCNIATAKYINKYMKKLRVLKEVYVLWMWRCSTYDKAKMHVSPFGHIYIIVEMFSLADDLIHSERMHYSQYHTHCQLTETDPFSLSMLWI